LATEPAQKLARPVIGTRQRWGGAFADKFST
jgi:hypothetical protein